jgi:hypothetical protein
MQMFSLDVAMCCNSFQVFHVFFCKSFQMHVLSVSSVFRRMLQVLHLDVSEIDRVLHLHPRLMLSRLGVFSYYVALHLSQTAEGARRARWMGHAMGWRHERECTLSPSIMRAGSASVPSVSVMRDVEMGWSCWWAATPAWRRMSGR